MNYLVSRATLTPLISQIKPDREPPPQPYLRALVVGGTKGIGSGIAQELVASKFCNGVDIVGRDESAAKKVLENIQSIDSEQRSRFLPADLSTVVSCKSFVDRLKKERDSRYDLIVFTVGAWPDYSNPLTEDGFHRVAFLDVISRFILLDGMLREKLVSSDDGRTPLVMSVVSCSQKQFAFDTQEELREYLKSKITDKRASTDEERASYTESKNFPATLAACGLAHDLFLVAIAKRYSSTKTKFIGTFPGLVATEVAQSTIGGTLGWLGNFVATKLPGGMVSVDESGRQHVAVLREVAGREDSVGSNGVSSSLTFWDACRGEEHLIAPPSAVAEDDAVGKWFLDELGALK